MGLTMPNGGLTENQKKAAKLMKISEEDMYNRLLELDSRYEWPVAIIIPVYNGEKYIKESIESALRQTVKCNVVVINDGSTDKTHSICKEIDGIVYLIKPNGGTASALNCGIRNAKARWIHWLSADDILYPDAIENMIKEIGLIPNNINYIYYSNYDIIDKDGNFIREFIEPLDRNFRTKEERFKELLGNYYGNGSSSMIHKSVFEKIGNFNEALPYAEDYDFWLKCMKADYDLKLIPIKTLKYRNHDEQMTRKVDHSIIEFIRSRYI